MMVPEIDLLAIERGSVAAPAGCGKTHVIAASLAGHVKLPRFSGVLRGLVQVDSAMATSLAAS